MFLQKCSDLTYFTIFAGFTQKHFVNYNPILEMKFSVFCFVLVLSHVLCEHSMKVRIAENHQCIVNVSKSSIKEFNDSLHNEKKVVHFQINYDSEQADHLTKSIPDNHFANPNEYMWLYDGDKGLPVYMNAPYDFDIRSLFILNEYTSTLQVNMSVSKSCNEKIVSRVDFLRLVFHQLIQIVSRAPLPDKKATAYICYDINNKKNLPYSTLMAYQRLGFRRKILLQYCCKVTDYHTDYNKSTDLCKGKTKSAETVTNVQSIAGAVMFAVFPMLLGFISSANLHQRPQPFSLIQSYKLENDEGLFPPFGTHSSWLSEHKPYYSALILARRVLLFEKRSAFASKIRRSLAVMSCLFVVFADLLLHNIALKQRLKSYLDNNIPLGYLSMIFGYEKSAENTDYFLGGPYVWFSTFITLGLIVINIPTRLSETIAYSTLHQQETYTFLIQDISLLQRYGSLKLSNIHDYDLLYAILKASLLTALNPSFWYAVIKQWFGRCKRIYNYFNRLQVIYQLMGVCVTFLCSFLSIFLCVNELLLCIIYYGCPVLQIFKALPHSYFQCFIWPLLTHRSFRRKILGVICLLLFLPIFLFLFLCSIHLFLTSFALLSCYSIYSLIALVAKPDAIAYVLLFLMLIFYLHSIAASISKTYIRLQKLSITLAPKVCKDFVYTKLGTRFIYRQLYERIIQEHHPIRFEIAKAIMKLALLSYISASCAYSFESLSLNMSTYIKIGLLIFTSMIPKLMSVLKDTMWKIDWDSEAILETIYIFQQETNFPNYLQMVDNINPNT